jgi:long-chain acyl-CoA synthetase
VGLRVQHAVFDRLVYGKLRAAMGGRIAYAVSGGAPLGARLGHFFRGIGITILEGYGLTETSAPSTVNLPTDIRIGSVGKPLPGTTVRTAEDGDWRNEAASAEVLRDGWFTSGDLGEIDDDGFLRITGRKKEIIVTAGGKNVAPAVLEDRLRAHPLVSQCMVVGDQRPFIACLVTLDPEALPAWAERNGKPAGSTAADLTDDPALLAELQSAVDEANRAVSKAEAIRRFAVLPEDWTEQGGQITPSLKVKRSVVLARYTDDVERLYAGPRS